MASAPTIWRGSTLWRLPTAMRYAAIGWPLRDSRGAPRRPCRRGSARSSKDRVARLRLRLEEQRLLAVHDGGQGGGDVDLGHVVLADVVGDHVAEEVDPLGLGQRLR